MTSFKRISTWIHWFGSKRTRSRTVRYMFPALLGTATLLGATALTAVNNSFVVLESSEQIVEVGDLFEVTVVASAHTPVNAVDILVSFPADSVEVFGVDRGQSVLTLWTEDPVITNSSVALRGGTFRKGFIGEHEIATINFRALKTGQYDVLVSKSTLFAGDGQGTEVPVTVHPRSKLSLFNFDETTSESDIAVAIQSKITTDLTNDGKVTLQDISAFMGAWSNKSQIFDFDNDGKMTFRDFSIILADFFLQ